MRFHRWALIVFAHGLAANASLVDLEEAVHLNMAGASTYFLQPSELHPEDAEPILRAAPAGLYLTVGTERGVFGILLAGNATHLLTADTNPMAVVYNRVNFALLALGRTHDEYIHLRYEASLEDWRERARQSGLKEITKLLLQDPGVHAWWYGLQHSDEFSHFTIVSPTTPASPFRMRPVNYLEDDRWWPRLHAMAVEGRLASVLVDWRDARAVRRLAHRLHEETIPLAVIDTSNVWYPTYAGWDASVNVLRRFAPLASPESIFMIVGEDGGLGWRHLGFTLGRLKEHQTFERLDALARYLARSDRASFSTEQIPPALANRLNPEVPALPGKPGRELVLDAETREPFHLQKRADPTKPAFFRRVRRACASWLLRTAIVISPD